MPADAGPLEWSELLGWQAALEHSLGHVALATALFEQALPHAERLGNAGALSSLRGALLRAYADGGRLEQALALAERILAAPPPHAGAERGYQARLAVALAYNRLGLYREALALAEAAQAAFEGGGPGLRASVAAAAQERSLALDGLGRRREARAAQQQAVDLFRSLTHGGLAGALLAQARLCLADDDLDAALARSEEAGAVLEDGAWRARLGVLDLRAAVALRRGQPGQALDLTREALALAERDAFDVGVRSRLLSTHAEALLALGRAPEALEVAAGGVRLLAAALAGLGEGDAAGLAEAAGRVARLGTVAAFEQQASPASGALLPLERLWWLREAGHALLLSEGLGRARLAVSAVPEQAEHAQALEELAAAQTAWTAARATAGASAQALEAAEARLGAARDRHAAVLTRIARLRPGGARSEVAPVELSEAQRSLAPDEALLAYAVQGGRLGAFVVRASGSVWRALGSAEGLEQQLEAWLDLASTPGGPEALLGARLAQRLLVPLLPDLPGVMRLVVLPDGPLARLPLAALRLPGSVAGAPGPFVVERFEVTCAPSATARALLRARERGASPGRGVLAVGAPSAPPDVPSAAPGGGPPLLPDLPGAAEEARRVVALHGPEASALLLGEAAGLEALERALAAPREARWRAVHLACHALLEAGREHGGGLVLAGGRLLSAARILVGPPWRADVVLLSACATDAGSWRPAEGVLGLVRALLLAGASSVAASAWRVDDAATLDLMVRLHQGLVEQRLAPGAALAAAQRGMLAAGGPRAHPSAWGAFVLWGDEAAAR